MNDALTERLFNSVIAVEKNLERHTTILETMVNELKEIKTDRLNDLQRHDERVKDLEHTLNERAKTQWPVIFGTVGAASVFLAMIGGIVAYAWIGDIQDLQQREANLRQDLQQHSRLHGHPEAVIEKVDGLESHMNQRFDSLTERLNRIEDRTKVLYKEGKPY